MNLHSLEQGWLGRLESMHYSRFQQHAHCTVTMRITLPQRDRGHRCTVDLCTDKLLVAAEDKGPCMHVYKH